MNIITRASYSTDTSWPLCLSTLWIRFIAFSPLGCLSIGLWSVVKQAKFVFITLEYRLTLLRIINMLLLLINWSKCGSQFANSFSMFKYSCTICSKRFFDIFRVSAFSIKFTLQSFELFCGLFWGFRRKQPLSGVHCVHHLQCTFKKKPMARQSLGEVSQFVD
jgi:hypothetical protein